MAAPTTLKFDDEPIRRARSREGPGTTSSGIDLNDGIVFSRTISTGRRSSRSRSRLRTQSGLDEDDPEYTGLRRPEDYKKRQVFRGSKLFFLAYQSIGVIYGDIGTSPLYVFSSTFVNAPPKRDDLIGVLSLIIWSLLMMVTVKYILIILHADNEGEGGTFSCYSLLSRYANITHRDPREEPLVKLERWKTEDMRRSNLQVRTTMEKSTFLRGLLKTVGVLAVSMVMSDGVLTPAQSVLGAVQGLEVVVPNISNSVVVGTTCGILICLFAIQPFGTTKIGVTFAPIIIIWLGFLAAFGIYNLVYYDYGVLKAFNPGEGFEYLIRHGTDGWRSLGGVLLAFTGVEALFADLGAFSMRAIQISWLGWCLPCLLLAYIGQAAYIAVHPAAYAYPVFYTAPPHMLIPILVIAILAAIVASQAIITATFQLIAQIVKLSYFPQIQVVHTSKIFHNQLYVPLANYLLLIGTVVITAVFRNTTSLGQAYGVCVMFVTFFDTTMCTLTALIVWRLRPYLVFLPWLIFACIDGTYLSSALTKVPNGAWFTITLASVLAAIFILWRFGKEQQWKAEAEDRHSLATFVHKETDGTLRLAGRRGGEKLSITRGLGIYFDKGGIKTPIVFSQFISKLVSTTEVIIFFHLRALEYPTVPVEDRFVVSRIRYIPNCYRVIARHGFMDEVVTGDLAPLIFKNLREFVLKENSSGPGEKDMRSIPQQERASPPPPARPSSLSDKEADDTTSSSGNGVDGNPGSGDTKSSSSPEADTIVIPEPENMDLADLQRAYDHRVIYVIGKEEMSVKPGSAVWRLVLLKMFLFIRDYSRTKMANLKVPTERLVEIGFVKQV